MKITVLSNNRVTTPAGARVGDGDLWMPETDYRAIEMEPDTDDPPPQAHLHDGDINVSAYWRHLQRPVLCDDGARIWVLGASARQRGAVLESLQAPDFTLPDLDGNPHSLSDYRGQKVFLASWASW